MESLFKVKVAKFILHSIFKVQVQWTVLFTVINRIKMMYLLFVHKSLLPKNRLQKEYCCIFLEHIGKAMFSDTIMF